MRNGINIVKGVNAQMNMKLFEIAFVLRFNFNCFSFIN